MAKEKYKIPNDIDMSYFDAEFSISQTKGQNLITLKTILWWGVSLVILLILLTKSPVGYSGIVLTIVFAIGWLILTAVLGHTDKTGRMNVTLIPVLLKFMVRQNRYIYTKQNDDIKDFFRMTGIVEIKDNGVLIFADGTKGFGFRVTGSASYLLFEEDKNYILDGVDAFFRKLETNVELIWITNKEAQKIKTQYEALERREANLKEAHPDMIAIITEQKNLLTKYVGVSFKSIHQYMIVKGASSEMLKAGLQLVRSDAENSAKVFKRLIAMQKQDFLELQKELYTVEDIFDTKAVEKEYKEERM